MKRSIIITAVSIMLTLAGTACNDIIYSDKNVVTEYQHLPGRDTLNLLFYLANRTKPYGNMDMIDIGVVMPEQMNGINIIPVNQNQSKTDTLYYAEFKNKIGFESFVYKNNFPLVLKPFENDSNNQIKIQFNAKGRKAGVYIDTLVFNNNNFNGIIFKSSVF